MQHEHRDPHFERAIRHIVDQLDEALMPERRVIAALERALRASRASLPAPPMLNAVERAV